MAGGGCLTFRVLVVPEDPTYNGYILGPLTEALLAEAGKTNARLDPPHPQFKHKGFEAALAYIENETDRWPMIDLFLFMPDRDADPAREGRLADLETRMAEKGRWVLSCAAREEVEIWLMGTHPDKIDDLGKRWSTVRSERKPSEGTFLEFIDRFGDESPGQGRKRLMREGLPGLRGLLERCGELKRLVDRIQREEGRPPR